LQIDNNEGKTSFIPSMGQTKSGSEIDSLSNLLYTGPILRDIENVSKEK
jgi:hypothetical protein